MRRFTILCALVLLAQSEPVAWANSLPETVGYTIYSHGQEVGHSDIRVTETETAIELESSTRVRITDADSIIMACRTVADPQTFLVRTFEFNGSRGPSAIDGQVTIAGDSVYSKFMRNDNEIDDYRISPFDRNLVLEDYIMEHEILIALAHDAREGGGNTPEDYGLLFPSSLTVTSAKVAFASTVEIESDVSAVVCKKLIVKIAGSKPFASYFDPERRLPVYMAFPQTNVEVFLDDFFGESPVTRYREHSQPVSQDD
jgi:hypothetical protein